MDEVFVYGTLKEGFYNNHLLGESRFICEAKTTPDYRLYEVFKDGFPGMIPSDRGVSVKGEIFQVAPAILERLDQLERVPSMYRRERIKLADFDREVWAYLYNREVNEDLDCGDCWPSLESIQRKDEERWAEFQTSWKRDKNEDTDDYYYDDYYRDPDEEEK